MNFEINEVKDADGNRGLVKSWTKGVPFEDEARRQVEGLAVMPFIASHVAVMPDVHAGIGATVGSVIATRRAVIPAAVGVDLGCFVGSTRIPLLDGTQATLEALCGRKDPFWVYSLNRNLDIVPGRALAIRTRVNASLMRVVVSGGDEIICTPDHRFMMNDGSYREANDLRFNDSLMPLYRRWESRDGYESCSNGKGRSRPTHKLAWSAVHGAIPEGHVVHHENHNHMDNRPENLRLMTVSEHSTHHRTVGHRFNNASDEFKRLRAIGIAKRAADPEVRRHLAEVGTKNIKRYMESHPEHYRAVVAENGARGADTLRNFNTSPRPCDECEHVAKNPASLNWHKRTLHRGEAATFNHKVLSVEHITETADVFCLQVEEHHNFALAAGVFVHNCGMVAQRTQLTSHDLPDNLAGLRSAIEAAIPHGRTHDGGANDRGAWGELPEVVASRWNHILPRFERIVAKHPSIAKSNNARHLGTLGTGNHFIELCLDELDRVWVMLHSGSRGVGGRIGSYFIEIAKKEMERHSIHLPDKDLSYLEEGSEHFADYVEAVEWAQDFALVNRGLMMGAALRCLRDFVGKPLEFGESAVNCHHNYVSREHHFGEDVLVTRKGAVSAKLGELGIIPGSMGARSFIVRGKGNPESFCSCSHGAGRRMSRTAAKKRYTLEDHARATAGIECRKDEDVIDETPMAYKSIDDVMAAQSDLVEVVHTLRQIVCVKG